MKIGRGIDIKEKLARLAVFALTFSMTGATLANPVLDNVAAGEVAIQQVPNSTVVNQSSPQAIINWQSFNIGAAEKTHFQQPAGAVALNRISPNQGASQIYGQLSSTGKIILVNQAGIFFGPGSRVDVGGMIASTSDISDANFLAGKYSFDKPSAFNGSIINQGTIRAAEHGLIALIGTAVRNDGTIQAHMGNVVLASGNKFTIDLYGDQLVNFSVDEGSTDGIDHEGNVLKGVTNSEKGALIADGGTIIMTARAARGVVDNVVNMKGVAQARSVSEKDGVIILDAGEGIVNVSGKVDVSGKGINERGGKVKILAKHVQIEKTAVIDASGYAGGGEVLIGGNYQGIGPEQNAYSTRVDKGASINADAIQNGNGGRVIVWADNDTRFYGSISARGGSQGGNGGFVETSGKKYLDVYGSRIDLRAPLGTTGTWLLDPENLTIQTTGPSTADFGANTYTSNVDSSILTVADLESALTLASIIVQTGVGGAQSGDITVANAVTWNNANSLTLSAHNNITVNASITNTASGSLNITADSDVSGAGAIVLNSPITLFGGTLTLSAANTGNSITTSDAGNVNVTNFTLSKGQWTQTSATNPEFYVANDFQIATGTTFIRNMGTTSILGVPHNVIADVYGLQGIATQSMSNNYALSQDIDASSTTNWESGAGFLPIGTFADPFTGNLNGQNYVVDGLIINRPSLGFAGLFAAANLGANSISNIGLTNVDIYSGGNTTGALGIVVGVMFSGTLSNVFTTGTLEQAFAGGCGYCGVGGLVGVLFNPSLIENSYNLASVTTLDYAAGGLSGYTSGTIDQSYNAGAVYAAYEAGGLAGELVNTGTITNSYNLGSVTGLFAGGLVGAVYDATNVITNSYATGPVNSTANAGSSGLISENYGVVTVTNSFWDIDTTGQTGSAGSSGLAGYKGMTTAEMMIQDNFTKIANGFVTVENGWDFSNPGIWFTPVYDPSTGTGLGYTRPILQSEYSTTIRNGHQLQLIAMDPDATYNLANDIDLSNIVNPSDIWGTSVTSGNGWVALGSFVGGGEFMGQLNGNGYIIDNLYSNLTSTSPAGMVGGLFLVSGGVIQDLGLTNVNLTGFESGAFGALGFWHAGIIRRSFATGTINVDMGASGVRPIVGGLASSNFGTVENSYSTVNINVTGVDPYVGGLLGRVWNGGTPGTVTDSYSTGSVTASGVSVGGFVGYNFGSNFYNDNYWNTETSGQAASIGATGITTALMQQQATFSGWNFSNSGEWAIIENNTNPLLQSINTLVSGTTALSGTVGFAVNGIDFGPTYDAAIAGGSFYQIFRTVDIAANDAVIASINSGTSNAVTLQQTSGDAIAGLALVANTLTVGDAVTQTISNSDLAQARGLLLNNDILYFGAGSNIILGNSAVSGVTLNTTAATTYHLDGNINPYSGVATNYVFNGPVTLGSDVTLTTDSGNISFLNGIAGADNDLALVGVTGGNAFTLSGTLTDLSNVSVTGGSGGSNSLTISTSGDQEWALSGINQGLIDVSGVIVLQFDAIDNIIGGSGNNTLTGDATSYTWNITDTNIGNIDNELNYTNFANLMGGSGNDSFILSGGSLAGSLDGGGGANNTLTGNNVANTWNITSSNAGTVNGIASGFVNVQNLVGGTDNDSFVLSNAQTISSLDGGGGTNSLDLSAYAAATNVNLQTAIATGVGTFSNIGSFIGSTANSNNNILTSSNSGPHTWNITANNSGNIDGTTSFSQFGSLVGGADDDTFILNNVVNSLNGGTGENTLTIPTGVTNWTVSGANAGSVAALLGGFNNIQNLTGGTGTSTFYFTGNGSISGVIDGGNTTNVNMLDFSGYAQRINLTLALPTDNEFNSGSLDLFNDSSTRIASFIQVQGITGTPGTELSSLSTITLPDKANITVVPNSAGSTSGYIGDRPPAA